MYRFSTNLHHTQKYTNLGYLKLYLQADATAPYNPHDSLQLPGLNSLNAASLEPQNVFKVAFLCHVQQYVITEAAMQAAAG